MAIHSRLVKNLYASEYLQLERLVSGKRSRMASGLKSGYHDNDREYRAFMYKVNGEFEGEITAWALVIEDDEPEVHFFTHPKYRGKGFAMDLARKIVSKYGRDCYHVRDRAEKFYKAAGFNKGYAL